MSGGLTQLIDALTVLRKYGDPDYPTHCEHDELTINGIEPSNVAASDIDKLEELGFLVSSPYGEEVFMSFRFGSA